MNRIEANQLLDRLKDGETYSLEQISAALFATGDLYAGMRSARVDTTLSGQNQRSGCIDGAALVGGHEGQHSEDTRPGWSKYLDCRDVQATKSII